MSQQTSEQRVAKAFGLEGDSWMRHANAMSVWTRFAILPVLAVAIWSYDWIGWWSLVPVTLILGLHDDQPAAVPRAGLHPQLGVEGRLRRTDLGRPQEGRDPAAVPVPGAEPDHRLPGSSGSSRSAYGLVRLDVFAVVAGVMITQLAKFWYLDRMVLLFDEMKGRNAEYASWEY